jgi:MYXO-CTERM domain-containing protein
MRSIRPLSRFLCLAALTFAAGVARADVAPPDLCTSPGQPCQSAGPQYNSAGICTMTTCTRSIANPDGGARIPMSYACNLCMAADAGTTGAGGSSTGAAGSSAGAGGSSTGAGGSSAGTAGSTGAAGSTSKSSGGSSGCAVAGQGVGRTGAVFAFGLAGLALGRRRRRTGR